MELPWPIYNGNATPETSPTHSEAMIYDEKLSEISKMSNRDHEEPAPLAHSMSRQSQPERCMTRIRSAPFGFTAGLNEENFDRSAALEQQKLRNERNAKQGSEKDPNLVEWDGPDDPGNPMNCKCSTD